jgi:hypothetical protein
MCSVIQRCEIKRSKAALAAKAIGWLSQNGESRRGGGMQGGFGEFTIAAGSPLSLPMPLLVLLRSQHQF